MRYRCLTAVLLFAFMPVLLAVSESAHGAPAAAPATGSYDEAVAQTVELIKQGKNTEAQAQARKLVSQNHARYEGHLYLGITYFNQSDYNAAEAELNQALGLAPQAFKADVQQALTLTINTQAHDNILAEAQKALADGLKSKAAKLFADAANTLPSDTATALKAAQLEYDLGNFLDAADLAAAGRAAASNDASKAQAQALLDKWQSDYSAAADTRYHQALELVKQGKYEDALPSLEKAAPLLTKPQDGDITLWLAYYSAGKTDESLKYLKAWIKVPGAQFDDISSVDGVNSFKAALISARSDPAHAALLADAFGTKANTAVLWVKLSTLTGHSGYVEAASFSPDGRYVVTGSDDKTAKIWDAATGEEVRTLTGHTGGVTSASFSPDGRYIVTASWKTAKVWETSTGKEMLTLALSKDTSDSISFSMDGHYIVSGVQVWDGHYIVGGVQVWDATTGKEGSAPTGLVYSVNASTLSPDGNFTVICWNNSATVGDTATEKEVHSLTGHTDKVTAASFSPDGRYIVTGSYDKTAKIWEAATGKEVRTLTGHTNIVTAASFSPDGHYVVTGSGDNTSKVWETATGKEVATLTGHIGTVMVASFSPDGHYIVTGSEDKTAMVWERLGP